MEKYLTDNVFYIIGIVSGVGILAYFLYSIKRAGGANAVLGAVTKLVNNVESTWMNLLAAGIPYSVSLIPAMMTYRNAKKILGVDDWEALNMGAAIEFFGIVAMDTAIRFWHHNKKWQNRGAGNKAPFMLAVVAYLFYLAIIITVNVVMEIATSPIGSLHWFRGEAFWRIVALSLLSTLSIYSGMVVAMRTQHKEVLNEKSKDKPQGNNNQPKQEQPQPQRQEKKKHASDFAPQITAMLDKTWANEQRVLSPKEITTRLKLDHNTAKGYVSTKTTEWRAQNNIPRDGASSNKFTI
jgi:hypothetical protein